MSRRATGLVGLTSFALIAAAGIVEPLWDAPGTTASSREISDYLARNAGGFTGALTTYALGMSLFFVFAVGLWGWFKTQIDIDRSLAMLFMLGSALLVGVVLAGFVPMLVLAYRAPAVANAHELYDLCFGLLAISGAPTSIALGAYAVLVFRTRALPVLTAWIALVGGAAHVVILFSFVPDSGFFSLEGGVIVAIPATLFLWLLLTSACLLAPPSGEKVE